tara:strand:- start:414 stop:686 length:273 start_codon:yes stop_codon:yes gene_type:complete
MLKAAIVGGLTAAVYFGFKWLKDTEYNPETGKREKVKKPVKSQDTIDKEKAETDKKVTEAVETQQSLNQMIPYIVGLALLMLVLAILFKT